MNHGYHWKCRLVSCLDCHQRLHFPASFLKERPPLLTESRGPNTIELSATMNLTGASSTRPWSSSLLASGWEANGGVGGDHCPRGQRFGSDRQRSRHLDLGCSQKSHYCSISYELHYYYPCCLFDNLEHASPQQHSQLWDQTS